MRSPEIVNVSELRVAPLVLGGVLLASLALGLWLAVTLSVRDRRRELAVLRALGFAGRDVRRSVRWQGLTLVAVGLVVGIPLGIIGGRAAWRFFADQLGVIPRTSVPLSWLALEVLLTAVLGWFAVALPARAAARVSPTESSRLADDRYGGDQAGSRPVRATTWSSSGASSGTGTAGPKARVPSFTTSSPGGEVGDEAADQLERGVVDVVGLAGGAGQVPAVHDQLVERHQPGDLAGHLDRAGRGHAVPGGVVAPGRGQLVEGGRDRLPPGRVEVGGVAQRRVGIRRPPSASWSAAAVKATDRPPTWSSRSPTVYPGRAWGRSAARR